VKVWKRSWLNHQFILAFANLSLGIAFIILAWSKLHFFSYVLMIGILLTVLACLFIFIRATYIITSDEKISIYNRPFGRANIIYWSQIKGYEPPSPHTGAFINLKYQDIDKECSQTIDVSLLQAKQRNEFLQLLNTKLDFLKKSEMISCLECGNLIRPEEDSCSKCGWSWSN
jgi:hypothetical protein